MGVLTFWIIVVNMTLFFAVAVSAWVVARRESSARMRLLARVVAVVALAFVLGAITRGIAVAVRLGWLEGRVADFMVGDWHLVQSVAALILGIAGITIIGRVAGPLRSADRIASSVSEHLLAGGTLDQLGLTNRETDVLEAIGQGHVSDQEIGALLFISPATAGTHVKNIMRKTGVKSRRELVLLIESARI